MSQVDKVRALEGVIAKHDATKCELGSFRELVEEVTITKSSSYNVDRRYRMEERKEELSGVSAKVDNDSGSIRAIAPHELERVEEDEDRRMRRVKLRRPRTINVCTPQSRHRLSTNYSSIPRCSRINSNRPLSYRAHCKRSEPPHKAPYQHLNLKSSRKFGLQLWHLRHLQNQNPHPRHPSLAQILSDWKRPSTGNGDPYMENGHRNANDSHVKSGRVK